MQMANDTSREKVPLGDIKRVRQTASAYLTECAETGTMPTVRGCAARLGLTRGAIYDYVRKHPGGELAKWLEDFSDVCGEVMMTAAMQGTVSPVPAIFVAKSRYSWREAPVQIELGKTEPFEEIDAEALKARILADVVVPDE